MYKYFMYTGVYVTPETVKVWVQIQEEYNGVITDSVESPRYLGPIVAEPVITTSEISGDVFKTLRATLTREISL